jgi:RNA polymerase primary sigma factor
VRPPKLSNGKQTQARQPNGAKPGKHAPTAGAELSNGQPVREALENGEAAYDSLQSYMRELGREPLLSREEERRLARKVRAGDPQARERMILANLRLVVRIARGYENMGLSLCDLINEGNIGLMKAVERYNPRKAKLSTYAAWWIKQHIKRALANQTKTIRLPVHVVDTVLKLRRVKLRLQEQLKREPTDEEMAAATGVPAPKVRCLMEAATSPLSLDAEFGDGQPTIGDVIPDENAISPAEAAEISGNARIIRRLLAELPERERVILESRFGFGGGERETLEVVGRRFGITRERIRQIQDHLLKQLRRSIEKLEDRERNEILQGIRSSTVPA